jgi:hypothetical protein
MPLSLTLTFRPARLSCTFESIRAAGMSPAQERMQFNQGLHFSGDHTLQLWVIATRPELLNAAGRHAEASRATEAE